LITKFELTERNCDREEQERNSPRHSSLHFHYMRSKSVVVVAVAVAIVVGGQWEVHQQSADLVALQ
jgi:hypothetical protein